MEQIQKNTSYYHDFFMLLYSEEKVKVEKLKEEIKKLQEEADTLRSLLNKRGG